MQSQLLLTLALTLAPFATAAQAPRFTRFFQVIMENTDYDVAIEQPYMKSLMARGRSLDNMHGLTHPSQPNYLHMVAGTDFGWDSDDNVNITGSSIADTLEAAGKTWGSYQETYPGNCFQEKELKVGTLRLYERKHNPFLSFVNVHTNATRCANIVDEKKLAVDIANKAVPDYVMYVPNQTNDGHGSDYSLPQSAAGSVNRIAVGDAFLQGFLEPLLKNDYFKDTLFVLTFDESDVTYKNDTIASNFGSYFDGISSDMGYNKIYTVLLGAGVEAGSADKTYYNHWSQIALLNSEWNLAPLGTNETAVVPFKLSDKAPVVPATTTKAASSGYTSATTTCTVTPAYTSSTYAAPAAASGKVYNSAISSGSSIFALLAAVLAL